MMILTGGSVFCGGGFQPLDIAISKGRIVSVGPSLSKGGAQVIELNHCLVVPGFTSICESLDFLIRRPLPPAPPPPPRGVIRRSAPCPI